MTPTETVALCRFARALCPQQHFDEMTPDAWGEVLRPLRFEDCKVALVELGRKSPFVSPSEIYAEVKRIRAGRLTAYGDLPDPPADLDASDVLAVQRWQRATRRAIADGNPPERPALTAGVTHDTHLRRQLLALRGRAARGERDGLDIA